MGPARFHCATLLLTTAEMNFEFLLHSFKTDSKKDYLIQLKLVHFPCNIHLVSAVIVLI